MVEPEDGAESLPTSSEWSALVGSEREDQYTPMGEIYMLGDFAMGVRRARGWKRWVSLAMALLLLGLAGLGVVYSVIVLAAG